MADNGIYIATQKKILFPVPEGYIPIQVGAINQPSLGYQRDDSGENISIDNPNYCELTAQYWVWKNVHAQIVGLCHYRRYFFNNMFSAKPTNILNFQEISSLLLSSQMILPTPVVFRENNADIFAEYHDIADLRICRSVLADKYPDYLGAFDRLLNSNHLHCYNMMITKKSVFDEYSTWLFSVLSEVQNHTDTSSYNKYNSRLYGFLSERLLNVWVQRNHVKICTKPVFMPNQHNPGIYEVKQHLHALLQ